MNTTSWHSPLVTGAASTSFSSLSGPWLTARSWKWKSVYSRVTVGTVLVTVDQITNQTVTSTSYNSEHLQFVTSGTFSGPDLHTRTDTDAAGTVTGVVYDGSEKLTVTYPTDYLASGTRLTWDAILPTFTANRTCCHSTQTFVPIPSHDPLPTSTASTKSEDSSGIFYQLIAVNAYFAPDDISHLWMERNLAPPYSGCPFTMCPSSNTTTAAPAYSATWQNAQAYLLATSTTTLSSVGAEGGGDNGGGTTTTPEAQQGPTTTPTNTSPQADQDSQAGNTTPPTTPTPTPSEQGPSRPTSPSEPDQNSQGGGSPPDTTPTQNPDVAPPGGQPTGGQSPSGDSQPPTPPFAPVITIGASPITANSADQYVVDDQTLAPGSAIEVSGTTYSLPSAGSPVVTAPLIGAPALLPTFTVGRSAVTANSASEYIVGGQTLTPGSAVVVSGTTISLASDASQLIVGSSTVSEASGSAATTSSTGTGAAASSSSQTPATQNSANERMRICLGQVCLIMVLLLFSNI